MSGHVSVLLQECLDGLNLREDGIYVDATLGRGGHSSCILKQCPKGHLYAFDRDAQAIEQSREPGGNRQQFYMHSFTVFHDERKTQRTGDPAGGRHPDGSRRIQPSA